MTITKHLYADSINDSIGNDPVTDQFDIEYTDAFYGTLQDNYITGSMIVAASEGSFITGSRGSQFSQIYAATEISPFTNWNWFPPNIVDFSGRPNLSVIAQPFPEKAKNSFRTALCHDDKERFYDSCLPNLEKALAHDGTKVKNINTQLSWRSHNLTLINTAASQSLMQTKNFPIADVNFVTFNVTKFQGDLGDPSINNEWTWAYPYENKFFPNERFLKLGNALGVNRAQSATLPAIPQIAKTLFPNIDTEIPNSFPLDLPLITYASAQYVTASNFIAKESTVGLVPLLPGRFPKERMPKYARNGNRTYYPYGSESYYCPTSEDQDDSIGFSFLVPCDVNGTILMPHVEQKLINSDEIDKVRHKFEPMDKHGLAKVFFGFGDINTMTYFSHSLGRNSYLYDTVFNLNSSMILPNPDTLNNIPYYTPDNVTLQSNSDSGSWYKWLHNGINPTEYVFEDNIGPNISRVSWQKNGQAETTFGANNCLITGSAAVGSAAFMHFDIDTNYSWQYQYTRVVASSSPNNFLSSSVARVNVNGYNDIIDSTGLVGNIVSIEEQASRGYHDPSDLIFATSDQLTISPSDIFTSIKFPPGRYRIIICYKHNTQGVSPDFAAITDFTLITYPECTTNINYVMGGNNYPDFQIKWIETTTYDGGSSYVDPYQGTSPSTNPNVYDPYPIYPRQRASTIFGIDPIIRGWKYGLQSGLPSYSRAVFRRDKFGQPRDMLEQRQYGKFINHANEIFANQATPTSSPYPDPITGKAPTIGQLNASPVTVNFVKQKYVKDDRGIGKITSYAVDPAATTSHNLSNEVTSSLPYFDGEARMRSESSYAANVGLKVSTISFTGTTTSLVIS